MEPQPLHRRIGADIERRILSGEWRPGTRVPTEAELMASYGCARMTVSRALTELAARGLVVRRRRAGTVVAHPPLRSSAVVSIPDIQAEVEGRGLTYAHRLLARAVRSAAETEVWLAGSEDDRLLEVETLHMAQGEPFGHERRLISLAAVPEAEMADFRSVPPGGWLLAHAPWTQAEHRIAAVSAGARIGGRLAVPASAACLRLERRTWRDGQGVTWACQVFPGAGYDLVARFSPTKG